MCNKIDFVNVYQLKETHYCTFEVNLILMSKFIVQRTATCLKPSLF